MVYNIKTMLTTTFLGNDLVWWTGVIGGVFFLLLVITAVIKQFNWKIFMKYQVKLTPHHHWFAWLAFGILTIHSLLAILQFNFNVYF